MLQKKSVQHTTKRTNIEWPLPPLHGLLSSNHSLKEDSVPQLERMLLQQQPKSFLHPK
jgi:hypothetical protein